MPSHVHVYMCIYISTYLCIYPGLESLFFFSCSSVSTCHRVLHQLVHTPVLREYSCRTIESLYSDTISPSFVGNSSKNEWLRRLLQVPMQVLADL